MMSKPSLLLILLTITTTNLLCIERATAQAPTEPLFFDSLCRTSYGQYSSGSQYETNLKAVVADLEQNAASKKTSYETSAGSDPDTVYGQYFCRGDVTSDLCGDCIKQAGQAILQNCTFYESSIIWYQQCTLRYSNMTMVGIEAEYPRSWYSSSTNVSDATALASVLGDTVDKLITESTQGSEPSLFGIGKGVMSGSEVVYCLVQCSPDLNSTQCETCLQSTYDFIPTCCDTMSKQVAIFYASCQLRYSTFSMFYTDKSAPPTPAPPPSPPGTPPSPISTEGLMAKVKSVSDSKSTPSNKSPNNKGASVALTSRGLELLMIPITFLTLLVV